MISMMAGIKAMTKKIQPVAPPGIKQRKCQITMDRIWRINARMSRGKGITIDRVMELEGICPATARMDLRWLLENGFVKFEMIQNDKVKKRLTTRLYTAVIK